MLYTQGTAAYGSVRNSSETSILPVSKVRQILHSNISYKRNVLTTREIGFPRFKNETWCMDHVLVYKLAKENNRIMFLLVHQGMFDRTVDAEGMKTKDSKETVRKFSTIITRKTILKKWVDKW